MAELSDDTGRRVAEEHGDWQAVQWYSDRLKSDGAQVVDLDFSDPTRKVIHAGPLFRQNDPLKRSVNAWKELWVVLFDNYLVMTKPKGKGEDVKYVVWKPPIRMELITPASFATRPMQRTNTLSWMKRTGRDSSDLSISALEHALDHSHIDDNYYPLSFHCHGKHGASYTLYASTLDGRNVWRRRMREAIALRRAVQEETSVFRMETITAETASSQDAPAHHPGLVTGIISCSLPFNSKDGRELVALGSEDGVWIGFQQHPETIQRVMSLKLVTQLAYLAEQGLMVVLADHVVFVIDIEGIVPTNRPRSEQQPARGLRRISREGKQVHFFSVGHQAGRTLVIMKQKKGLNSVFRITEVDTRGQFRVHRDFFIPSDSHDVLVLKTKICVLCPRGFEMLALPEFHSVTIPTEEELRRIGKKPTSKSLAMFRIREDEFLLCYDDFGLYIDKRGAMSRSPPLIEWEGVALQAAWHPPYVVLFGTSFIEIRHVESGRIAQIIPGHGFRCLWDGRGVLLPEGLDEFDDAQRPRIHALMDDSGLPSFLESTQSRSRSPPQPQHAVVLVPTERLVVPGTRYSPSLLSVADTLPPYMP